MLLIKLNIEFNMTQVANQSKRYKDMISILREMVKESLEDV